MPVLELALRFWLLRGCTDSGKHKEVCQFWVAPRPETCCTTLNSTPATQHVALPGQTVNFRLPSKERSTCFWATTRKKCPGEVCAPSERSKWKPPSRAPEHKGWIWIPLVRQSSLPLRYLPGGGVGMGAEDPAQHPPLCENSTSPLSSWACVKWRTSVSGAALSAIRPLLGCWMV